MLRVLILLFFASVIAVKATPEKPNFQDDILPILDQSCNSCHNPDKAKGSLILSTINGVMNGGSSGKVVVPEDGKSSLLYLLAARLKEPHMPPRGQGLETEQVKLLKRWIDQGLLSTATGKAIKKKITNLALELKTKNLGKPKGPPAMPSHLNLEPFLVTERAFTPSAMESAPWSPLLAIAAPKQIIFYNTETLELLGVLPYPEGFAESLAFSKNGSLLLASGGKGGKSGQVVAWDIPSGRRILTLGQEKDSILSVDINPDQSLIAIGGTSKIIKVFELGSGQVLYQIKKHSEWVTKVAISPDGILMATGDRNGGLYIWEAETGNLFYNLSGHQGEITDLSWRADGNILLSSSEDGTLRMWEMIGGSLVKDWEAHPNGVLSSHFDKNANILSSGRDKKVIYWDNNGNKITTISGFEDIVTEARFTQDGLKVIASDWLGNITVWNPLNGEKTGTLRANPPTIETRLNTLALKLSQAQKSFSATQEQVRRSQDKVQDIQDSISKAQKKNEGLIARLLHLESKDRSLQKSLEIEINKISKLDETIATHHLKIKKMDKMQDELLKGTEKEKGKMHSRAITDRESFLIQKKELSTFLDAELRRREASLSLRNKVTHSLHENHKEMKNLKESTLSLSRKIQEKKKALDLGKEEITLAEAAFQKAYNEMELPLNQITKWNAEKINSQRHAILSLYYQAEDEIVLLTRQLEEAGKIHHSANKELDEKTIPTTAQNSMTQLEQAIAELKKLAKVNKEQSDLFYKEYLQTLTKK
jgi:hypothetical protein